MPRKINIEGIAVRTGVSMNNHLFIMDELEKSFASLNGKPILKDHQATVDNSIGKVTDAGFVKEKDGNAYVTMAGFVLEDDKKTIEKIETGIISEVSIGAYAEKMLKESEESDVVIPTGLHFMEVSLTPTPAVKGTKIARASTNAKEAEEYKCEDCGEEFSSQEGLNKHMSSHEEEEKMNKEPITAQPSKVDYAAELAKVQEELSMLKLEQAKKELDAAKKQNEPKLQESAIATVAAVSQQNDSFAGYVIEKTEDGRMGIRKNTMGSKNPFGGN